LVRKLGTEEKTLWGRVMATVKPLHPAPKVTRTIVPKTTPHKVVPVQTADFAKMLAKPPPASVRKSAAPPTPSAVLANTLDGTWDRQIGKGTITPDVSVDLHGSGLSSAYARLDGALEQAIGQKMRVVLLVTGRQRSHDRASGEGRGAIASVVRDWLASSRHASAISAVRGAHPRHGGAGALYIILKR
jgi:DNA-nicking Smr family endonuclease